jgi:SAM-dependent methyltransferase
MFASIGGSDFAFATALEVTTSANNYNRWIADQFAPFVGRSVLEVGCGIGNLSRYWIDCQAFVGIDIEPACVAKCIERFRDVPSARFFHDFVGGPGWVPRWSEYRPDTIIAINVLEHIRDDVAALRGWRDVVCAGGGGYICVFVPAFDFAYSAFDKRQGHYRRYTKAILRDRLAAASLDPVVLRYFNAPGLLAWWATYVLLGRQDPDAGQVSIYDKVFVPVIRRVEQMLAPPFGNSVVAVCRPILSSDARQPADHRC